MSTQTESKYAKYWTPDGLHHCSPLRMWGFTCNNVATNMYFFLMAYSTYYLIGFVGMAVFLASSFATIMRVWDGITDPVIGYWIDKTNGRFGKNRPCRKASPAPFSSLWWLPSTTSSLPSRMQLPVPARPA